MKKKPASDPSTGRIRRSKARILVIDDHPIVREGLVGLLNRQPDMLCCADVGTPAEAEAATSRHQPNLALVDLRLATSDDLELIKSLRTRQPRLRTLVLHQLEQATYADRALKAGAHGFLMKEHASDELLGAIRTVLAGEIYVDRGAALKLVNPVPRSETGR